ncbi:hypothetical protein DPMN_110045 [Dreissena polymorpha]|uniref:Uncharacterized protein n=1 Tax=Dreissena polymorpha TaxID=45954 RepID=A0A9D4KC40_DREPO|nr:hypothetical protein DPMN_110045 [Dreissena polymorpha]
MKHHLSGMVIMKQTDICGDIILAELSFVPQHTSLQRAQCQEYWQNSSNHARWKVVREPTTEVNVMNRSVREWRGERGLVVSFRVSAPCY